MNTKNRMINFSLYVALVFSFTQNTLANTSLKPKCPDVNAIQSVNLDYAIRWDDWTVFRWASQYKTPNYWRFSIGKFHAIDETDAFLQAKNSLKTLTFVEGPNEQRGVWQCRYATADGYKGVAFQLEVF